jgi:putative pyruvate formate lyase activating enzyme
LDNGRSVSWQDEDVSMSESTAGYLRLLESGELERRANEAWGLLDACTLCPRRCKVNRLKGELGFCKTAGQAIVASYGAHFGEEAPLVGIRGSGTVFFSRCNLRCIFCQNFDISHLGAGEAITPEFLAFIFLALQKDGCHNINLVTPSHMVPFILKALVLAAREGLTLPLVYNTGGYDAVSTLRLMEGVVDIYMPDFKYWDAEVAKRLSGAADYPEAARAAIKEMHRQVGDLTIGPGGIATRGVLVRHLVLPKGLAGTGRCMRFLAEEISRNTYVNVMAQYRPCGTAGGHPPLDRRITPAEYAEAVDLAREAGLARLDKVL